ncbi:MAG: bis-aminopropyl spermidine synthase family protein [Candidatus Acetothermia bacterium]|jgi:predicted methyltransferase|nr:bis-aminopropyl spermidine synthase family protein [Candidatus Acetothermia bacterium]
MTLAELADRVRRESGLAVTARDLERILAALQASEDIWRIVDLAPVPMMATCQGLHALAGIGWVTWANGRVRLTPAGDRACRKLAIAAAQELKCPRCGGRGVELSPLREVAAAFHRIARGRPEASQEFDQGYVTEDSTIARVAFMWAKGDLAGKDLLVLGDDDLVSIAVALTRAPRRVVVLDIDPRIVNFVAEAARAEGLAVDARQHDLREPLPEELRGRFDTFFCDPTESLRGFLAFAGRGLAALRGPGCAGYLGLTRYEASLTKWRDIQRELLAAGGVLTDVVDDFHTYVNWPYIDSMRAWDRLPVKRVPGRDEPWYRSALIRVELVEAARVENPRYTGDIFNDEEAATT